MCVCVHVCVYVCVRAHVCVYIYVVFLLLNYGPSLELLIQGLAMDMNVGFLTSQ